jgi:hypothetical protein
MEKDFYEIEGYHATVGDAIKTLQQIAKNIGEDRPCYYTVTTFQDAIRWGENIILSEEIADDIVNEIWFYSEIGKSVRKVIENELKLQLEKRNLTLEDFTIY